MSRDEIIAKARGTRDDLRALASRVGGIAAHHRSEAAFSFGAAYERHIREARRLGDMNHAYMTAANLVAHAFGIPETSGDDPPGSVRLRLLDDEGTASKVQPYRTIAAGSATQR